ncbi:MAG TPA: hypothetical protein VLF39_04070 [Candidatus Saccharimonadales bacterium]|nr:hypothetical protein [Candidatus Saccharimonadales bacterium]
MGEFEQDQKPIDELAPSNENVSLVMPSDGSLETRRHFSSYEIVELDEYLRREQTAKQLGRLIGSSS